MARFGQGVNASLGKTDYSNYLRGALAGAKGVAAGGQSMGQGVANLGQGIKKYQENKVLQAEIMGGVEENVAYLVKNNRQAIANAPKGAQDILARMEDGKGVSLKDSAYLKSWSDSATKQTKANIENNALVSALSLNPDGTSPTGQQAAMRYFESGGQDRSLIGDLLTFGNNPLNVKALKARTEGQGLSNIRTKQEIEGTVPMTASEREQLKMKEDAARREEERLDLAKKADTRADRQVAASAEAASERSRVDQLANEGISIFNKSEDEFNKFIETLSPEDQGIVLTEVKQFKGAAPADSKLTASAIANIMMKKDGKKGPTFGKYLNKIRQASDKIVDKTGDKYVVKGLWNDIDKIPAFEELIQQFPQFKVLPDNDQEKIELPGGATITLKSPQ
jgi:hypothetical protein